MHSCGSIQCCKKNKVNDAKAYGNLVEIPYAFFAEIKSVQSNEKIADAAGRRPYMDKRKKAGLMFAVILGIGGMLYLGGILGQVLANYQAWLGGNGISGEEMMKPPDWNLLVCIRHAFTINGLKGMAAAILLGAAVVLYIKFHDKFDGNEYDPRGFK